MIFTNEHMMVFPNLPRQQAAFWEARDKMPNERLQLRLYIYRS